MAGPLKRAELRLEADVDGDGSKETGTFVMAGELQVSPGVRTGWIVGGQGSTINSVISQYIQENKPGGNKRQGFYVDLGGGAHTIDIEFKGWEGAKLEDGTDVQWGDDPNPSRTKSSATGQDPITQIDVLTRYLVVGEYDSRKPAQLEYGEYSSQGLYDPLDVVIEGPNLTRNPRDPDTFDGTMTLISAASLDEYVDSRAQTKRGT